MTEASQAPTWEQVGDYSQSDGEMAARLAAEYYGEPIGWQRAVLDVLLARTERDKFRFHTIGFAVPRQNGKSWDLRARAFYGMVTTGERILYTCQIDDTADDMFEKFVAPFDDADANPELARMLDYVHRGNGQKEIALVNGGYIRFCTRTFKKGRGSGYDVLIYDESQHLTRDQQAASKPAISANKRKNSQTIYIGTPPDDKGADVFVRMHDDVHEGKRPSVAWMEWAAQGGEVPDPHDRDLWYETNPSLGTVLDLESVEAEADEMDALDFARERLGWWSPTSSAQLAIPAGDWAATSIDAIGGRFRGVVAMGVKFSPDGSSYCVVGCKSKRDRSSYAVEVVGNGLTGGGTRRLAEELARRSGTVSVVVVDGASGASALCDNLAELGVPKGYVVRPRTQDVVAAAQGLVDSLAARTVWHTPGGGMDEQARAATRRAIGSRGGWGFDRAPCMEASSLALWGARTTRRDPTRRQTVL
ncbi:hypothetical protein ACTQ1D_01540 [Parafannyhessea umbonata]|uniref:hypothetical protein n=1 Tax=Parafannyhessea umbonata TaxID=604330 RepID=UPI003F9C6519